MPATPDRLARHARPLLLAAGVLAASLRPVPLAAQESQSSIPPISANHWVRVDACPERDGQPDVVEGRFIPDPAGIAVANPMRGVERYPLPRVRTLRTEVRRERDLRALGLVLGMVAGPLALVAAVNRDPHHGESIAMAAVVIVPLSVVAGGTLGYWSGSQLSAPGVWEVVPLPASHGTACAAERHGGD